ELIQESSRFQPLAWFCENQEGHFADRSWHELWQDYVREARRFNGRALTNLIGHDSVESGWKFDNLPKNFGQWERNHCLIVGEFLRRHHARLAHEIAIYGFPGLPIGFGEGHFPALGSEAGHPLRRLADLIGLTSRSHNISLRVCKAYLDSSPLYHGTPRPMGTAVLFPMALLRVADYLQIDRQRAPIVLLNLREPASVISIQEWKKHLAVEKVTPATDPRGLMVTVSPSIKLPLYLQLRELVAALQLEMDHSTAVLDEIYGTRIDLGLDQLSLTTRRVYSNLHSQTFRDGLSYVPEKVGFSADPNLLTLLVEPLYGKHPAVGIRELMQNAVDAVVELHAWSALHNKSAKALDFPKQASEVVIEFIENSDGSWFVRVRDKGIGMSSETIQNYFLRAGASFRQSPDWAKDFLDESGRPRVQRAGRFGVGAFAAFLLGPTIRLWTRHASADKVKGYSLQASNDSQFVEIRREDSLPIGTTIEVDLSTETILNFGLPNLLEGLGRRTDWFCWDWPKVSRRVVRNGVTTELKQEFSLRLPSTKSPEWAAIRPKGFDAVFWSFFEEPTLVCNGLRITKPNKSLQGGGRFDWPENTQLRKPCLDVRDSAANLPLTIQRDELSREDLPFTSELRRDVTLSFIAHALVCGPIIPTCMDGDGPLHSQHPLVISSFSTYNAKLAEREYLSKGLLRWCSSEKEFVVCDPWLYALLRTKSCLVYGMLDSDSGFQHGSILEKGRTPHASLCWNAHLGRSLNPNHAGEIGSHFLNEICQHGVGALGHRVRGTRVVASFGIHLKPSIGKAIKVTSLKFARSDRQRFEFQSGVVPDAFKLEEIMQKMEGYGAKPANRQNRRMKPDLLFVAEVATKPSLAKPESLIARIWNECLGTSAIPFNPAARRLLINRAQQHSELKIHIAAWEEMKSTDSKWAGRLKK
ncbi:MAG: ATP-binding protein, partial [Pedosphaera sp.]|nr:ATP-binding protein [Pedosphaera sp.]